MSSFFYTTKKSEPTRHPIPPNLSGEYVIGILHDDFILKHFFEVPNPTIRDETTNTQVNALELEPAADHFVISKLANGITFTEKLPGGFTMNNVYTVSGGDGRGFADEKAPSRIEIQEERSVQVFRAMGGLIKFDKTAPKKTVQLVRLFHELGHNGGDIEAALEVSLVRYRDPNT